jgi:polysaccharide biosynthesis transport protein
MLPENYTQEDEIHLRDYLQIVLRRKWIIIAILLISVTIATINTFKAVPIYQATVQVLIDKENPNVVSFQEVMTLDSVDILFYETQLKILSSRSLARRVIKSLDLKDSPEFKSVEKAKSFSIRGFLSSLVKKPGSKKESGKPDKDSEDSKMIDSYLSRLKIGTIKNSRLVNISFNGVHPDIITAIVNRHAHEYIEQNLEMRFAASQDAVEWLQKQLIGKKEKVEKAENALQLYKEKEQIVSLEDRQNIIVQKLEDLNTALTKARTGKIDLETLYNQTKKLSDKPDMIESIPDVMKSHLIQELKKDYINMRAEITKLTDRYGEKHPTMIKLLAQAKEQKNRINAEVNNIINSIETEYNVALSREESLSKALEEQKKVALDLNKKAIAYGTLKRESESERAMYDILLKRMNETDITGELKTSNVRVVDHAEVPRSSIKPDKKLNVFLAVLAGLALGIFMVFFLEYLDNTIKSAEDVERYLHIPFLGALGKVKLPKDEKETPCEMIAHDMPRSVFVENLRTVRTGIMLSSTDTPRKLILVTSTSLGEGKTFVSANLAITIAQTGKNTLLVDADFRKPRLNKIFNIEMDPGLSSHLSGESDFESIIKSTSVPNLSVVPCGLIPPNPAEMLGSHSMEMFCKTVRERFDTIIFDTPPSIIVTDAIVLSNIIDGVVFVIKSGKAVREAAKRAILKITNNKRVVFGAVMNCVDFSRGSYHYYSYYKYGYGNEDTSKDTVRVVMAEENKENSTTLQKEITTKKAVRKESLSEAITTRSVGEKRDFT